MATIFSRITFALALLASVTATAAEPGWGHLKTRIKFDGKPPERAKIEVTKDKDFCGMFDLRDESLIVDKEGGLANVLVWLDAKEAKVPIHADYEKTAKDSVPIDSRGCRFVPHVAFVRTTQELVLRNSDAIAHSARLDSMRNAPFNVLLVRDKTFEVTLGMTERIPVRIACSIHPWRQAYLMVQDHPYMAVSDARGNLEIANLPEGKWTFVFWHEKSGYLRKVIKGAEMPEWPKGRIEIEIKPGENDFGEIRVKPELFEG